MICRLIVLFYRLFSSKPNKVPGGPAAGDKVMLLSHTLKVFAST